MMNKKTLIFTTIICLLPLIYGLLVYGKLPAEVPTHWNAAGEIDGYSRKEFAVFGLPVFMAVLNIIVQAVMAADPKKANHAEKIKLISCWFVPVLALITVPITLLAAQGIEINVGFIITLALGILFLLIGNYLPKCRQNYTMGIKLPWTMNSEENWNKTHRMAGFIWTLGSIVIIFSAFLGSELILFPVCIIMAFLPMIYSFALYRKGI